MLAARLVAATVISLVGSVAAPSELGGQAPAVTLTLVPDSLSAAITAPADVQVVIRNGSANDVTALRLSVQPVAAWRVAFDTASIPLLRRNAAVVRQLRVSPDSSRAGTPPGTLLVRLDYRQGTGSDAAAGVAYVAVRTVTGRYARAEDVAEVQLTSSLAYLSDRRDGVVYVVVRNKSDAELVVSQPAVVPLPGTIVMRDTTILKAEQVRVAPYSTGFYPLRVTAQERVRPGKHLLVVTVPMSWTDGANRISRRVVLSREMEVGVFGESDILRLLGVPSLFVLPGLLILMTVSLLWKWLPAHGRAQGAEFPFKVASPEYWFLALGISLGVALLSYAFVGQWILIDYGLEDVGTLWLESIGVGAVGYLVATGALSFYRRNRERRMALQRQATDRERELRTPSLGDDPVTLLEKLARGKSSIPRRAFGGPAGNSTLFRVADADGNRIWATPAIAIRWKDDGDDDAAAAARDALATVIGRRDPGEIAAALRERHAQLSWKWAGGQDAAPIQTDPPPRGAEHDAAFIQVD